MEMVLDVYKRPFDPRYPVICMDESPKQLIAETRVPIPASPGQTAKYDYEYRRCGSCNIFITCEPLAGTRTVKVTERRTKLDWAYFVEEIADQNESAEKITLVMDNLNTHNPGSLYEAFPPDKAKALWDRFEFVYTPKHGSWLNIAEIELSVLTGQCLNRRIDNIEIVRKEVAAWKKFRDNKKAKVNKAQFPLPYLPAPSTYSLSSFLDLSFHLLDQIQILIYQCDTEPCSKGHLLRSKLATQHFNAVVIP